eukprot:NODE_126_length_17250_cov_2.558743.p11 type:complete len:225 gc:universal NODE_126_length_17250_cov_2.558743:1918-2592(+)
MSTEVEREIPMAIDLGALTVVDTLEAQKMNEDRLRSRTRDSCQLLINQLFQADRTTDEDGIYAQLPKVVTVLPREKPLPKPRTLTTWEKFAKKKCIIKKKNSAVVLDEETNEYKPRYGRKSKANEVPWIIEGKMNDEIDADPYADKKKAKIERVDKNQKQRTQNIKKSEKKQEIQKMIEQTEGSRVVPKGGKKRKAPLVTGDKDMNEKNKMRKLMNEVMFKKDK